MKCITIAFLSQRFLKKRLKMIKFIVLLPLLLVSCSPIMKWQTEYPDNFAEDYLEDLIENSTGYDFDLSPFTGDERQKLN